MGGTFSDFRNFDTVHTYLHKSSVTGEALEKVENIANKHFMEKYNDCKKNPECIYFQISRNYYSNNHEDDIYIKFAKKYNLDLVSGEDSYGLSTYYFKFS